MPRMRKPITAAALAAATLLALTACSSDSGSSAAQPSDSATASSAPAIDTGIPPEPTGAKRTALIAALKAVDPYIAEDEAKAIDHARNQCSSLNGGAANVDHSAAVRFGDDTHPLTDAQGKAINAALQASLCPKG